MRPSGWPTRYESWDTRLTCESGQMQREGLALRSGSGAIKHIVTKYFWLLQKTKNQELRIEKICGTVNPADLMTKHLDGKFLMRLCELLNIKHLGGRPSSAPKLPIDTEYISRASRALAAMTQLKQAAASEIVVHSGAEHEMWIDGYRVDYWTAAVWITVVIVTRCILMVSTWWKAGRVVETTDSGTQTLEEGRHDQFIPTRIMITKNGQAVHCRNDCPFFF